jgi:hypothetical protein
MMEQIYLGRDCKQLSFVGLYQLPSAFVNHPVMAMTKQDQVADVGRPASAPVHEVMGGSP